MRFKEVKADIGRLQFPILGDPDDRGYGLGKDWAENGCHEPPVSAFLYEYLKLADSPPIFWDIGAAKGYFSLLALATYCCADVHAFECSEKHLPYLRKNNEVAGGHIQVVEGIFGKDIKPDEYAQRNGWPDIIKIDIDGGEGYLLDSMKKVLARKPLLLLEVHFSAGPNNEERLASVKRAIVNYDVSLCLNHRIKDAQWVKAELPNKSSGDVMLLCQ